MAKYRQLFTEFWSDSFVLELTPEEKYFYLYLISNSKTTQCGIYEISKRIIETETGYNRETVEKLIKRFCDYKKILYCEETKELMVINWIKYNVPNNVNSIKCVQKELKKVKYIEFLKILFKKCLEAGLGAERIFENITLEEPNYSTYTSKTSVEGGEIEKLNQSQINKPLSRPLLGPYKPLPSNRIRSNKEEIISKKQEEEVINTKNNFAAHSQGLKNIIKVFEENVHAVSPLESEIILDFMNHVTSEVIIMAIHEAVIYNAKTMKYISKILRNWIKSGIKTIDDVKAYQKKWVNRKSSSLKAKEGGFCDFEQRTYDFVDLEKKLLGLLDSD